MNVVGLNRKMQHAKPNARGPRERMPHLEKQRLPAQTRQTPLGPKGDVQRMLSPVFRTRRKSDAGPVPDGLSTRPIALSSPCSKDEFLLPTPKGPSLRRCAPSLGRRKFSIERSSRNSKIAPRATLRAQQRAFDFFRREYNEERLHEALGQQPPAAVYTLSPRRYPPPLEKFGIDPWSPMLRVDKNGFICWEKRQILSAPRSLTRTSSYATMAKVRTGMLSSARY
jgi:hypothetical protein